jgi:3-hydroxybutyryl-CoA dehydrogenase
MIDVSPDALAKGQGDDREEHGAAGEEGDARRRRARRRAWRDRHRTSLDAVQDATVVVEAATEHKDLKFQIFRDLDRLAPAGAILASNTSSISITEIAAARSARSR